MGKGSIYKSVIQFGAVILSAAVFISPVSAQSVQAYVSDMDQGKPELSDIKYIQRLIDKTKAGEECRIPDGEYTVAGLSLTRPVKLSGGGKVTLRFYDRGVPGGRIKPIEQSFIAAVWSDGVTVDGVNFIVTDRFAGTGIIHFKGDNLEIRNNKFRVGQNCAGIISRAVGSGCAVEDNVFTAEPGRRAFPLIQLGGGANGAKITHNVLQGDTPDMLTEDFLSNFLSVESKEPVVSENEFVYTGPVSAEDFGGYEDSDEPESREAFAEMTKTRITGMNPWTRSMGDKSNPETGDGFSFTMVAAAGAAQIALGSAYLLLRRRRKFK